MCTSNKSLIIFGAAATMAKQVTPHQLELLLDFMEEHRTLALGHVRGKEGSVLSNRLWLQCSKVLNSDAEGAQKSADKWKKYYNQYKSRVKAKVRTIKHKGIGEGSAESSVLTPLEERLCSIVGGCSSPFNVTEDPLDSLANNNTGDGQDDEGRSKDAHFSGVRQTDSEQSGEYNVAPHVYTDTAVDYCHNTPEENIKRSPPSHQRRQGSFSPPTERYRRSPSPKVRKGFEDFEQRFISMEQTRISVDKELAFAINRQATAIEAFAGQMKRFVDIYERNSQQKQTPESPSTVVPEVAQKIKEEPLL